MEKMYGEERWLLANSAVNSVKTEENEDEEEEEEEALSLCDLPNFHQSRKETDECTAPCAASNEAQEDFNFCRSLSNESEMCAADEIFYQGQILPLRNSVSSEKGLLQFYPNRSISRSESMDHYCSGGLISSRSSSTSSGSSATTATHRKQNPKPPRNLFHSHPSPSPKITRFNNKQKINLNAANYTNSARKSSSSVWSIFRLGLVTPPPEIAFGDFKTRNTSNNKNFGSRNSTSTNSSGSVKNVKSGEKKKKLMADFLGGCKCSVDAVDTVPSRVVVMKRSASEREVRDIGIEEKEKKMKKSPKKMMKKQMSHYRTFEWLKQLSIESGGDEV